MTDRQRKISDQSLYKIEGIQFIMTGVKHCENAEDVITEIEG